MSASDDYIATIVGGVLAATVFISPLIDEASQVIRHSAKQVQNVLLKLEGQKNPISNRKPDSVLSETAFSEAEMYGLDGVRQGEEARERFLVELEYTATDNNY